MKPIHEIIPLALKELPAPTSEKLESQLPREGISPNSSPLAPVKPLRTTWQQKHLRLNAVNPGVQHMADCVENWCLAVRLNDRTSPLLVIAGTFGCGKSETLRRAAEYVRAIYMQVWRPERTWPAPIDVAGIAFPRFVWEIEKNENLEHYDDVAKSDVVFIDDIGAEEDQYRSGAGTRILGDLLGALEKKFVLIATNIEPDGWAKRWDGRVEDRLLRRHAVTCNLYLPEYAAESYAQWQLREGRV